MNKSVSKSLFQSPVYRGSSGHRSKNYLEICRAESSLEWDPTSIMSILSYGYPFGDRTIFNNISKQSWMSFIDERGQSVLESIPSHGFVWKDSKVAAKELFELLCEEILQTITGVSTVYVLLSGGLDSRVVASVVRYLRDSNRININIVAVTWGIETSRDVHYAKMLASIFEFEWIHIPLNENCLKENIILSAELLGASVSPIHLHRMSWFIENAKENSIVLAGSYGDSVGRSEFSGRTVLELKPYKIFNYMNLLDDRVASIAAASFRREIKILNDRSGRVPEYVKREHERQGHYMRNLIAHSMSVIDFSESCSVYQVFTDPKVFSYIWGLHPAARTDNVYAELFELLDRQVAEMPWARHNKSLRGNKKLAKKELLRKYHNYSAWTKNILQAALSQERDEDFYAPYEQMGVFNIGNLKAFFENCIENSAIFSVHGSDAYGAICWLLSLKHIAGLTGQSIDVPVLDGFSGDIGEELKNDSRSPFRRKVGSYLPVKYTTGRLRRWYLRKESLKKYPAEID